MLQTILHDRLFHFLVIAGALFGLHALVSDAALDDDLRVVRVDRSALEEFIAFRSRNFESGFPEARLTQMSDEELQLLIDDFVREEVLYREALALGMDQGDYVIRRRLVQKVEFVTQNLVQTSIDLTEAEVRAHLAVNLEDYRIAPWMTFTHVFFDFEEHTQEEALALAETTLAELNRRRVPFADSVNYGERFPYFLNYVERDIGTITSHFGEELAEQLFALEAIDTEWRGPFTSEFGAHLFLVTRLEPARDAVYEDVVERVAQDAAVARRAELLREVVDQIIQRYDVRQVYVEEERGR